jgi:hypothetical protein
MANQPHQIVVPTLITTTTQVGRCDISNTGLITKISIRTDNVNPNGDTEFDIRLDGTTIYGVPADRPEIATSADEVVQTGLSVGCTEGQKLTVHTTTIQTGGIGNYLVIQVTVEETTSGPVATDMGKMTAFESGNILY